MKNIKKKKIKEVDNNQVTIISDFEDTLIWMSARQWMWSNSQTELELDYPKKLVEKYWGVLSENQKEKLILDANREMGYAWSDKERVGRLLEVYNGYERNGKSLNYFEYDEFDFTVLRMAILYACGRQTIASSMLPSEIIEELYEFLTAEQKRIIVEDLTKYLDKLEKNGMERVFGDKRIDDKTWKKFMAALDYKNHQIVKLSDGSEIVAFRCKVVNSYWEGDERHFVEEEVVYPLDSYLSQSGHEIFIPKENIIE
jgi:hypothetical protein